MSEQQPVRRRPGRPTTPDPNRRQSAKQLLTSTADLADRLGGRISELPKFVIAAAVVEFAKLPLCDQVRRTAEARLAEIDAQQRAAEARRAAEAQLPPPPVPTPTPAPPPPPVAVRRGRGRGSDPRGDG